MKWQRENTGRIGRFGLFLMFALPQLAVGPGVAAEPFEIICDGEATDISADGKVVVGLVPETQETWRWTRQAGRVLLGRSRGVANAIHWGSPDVSDDGRVVSSTIQANGSNSETLALWSENTGWLTPEVFSAIPGTGVEEQPSLAWGLSGDGKTLVGHMRLSAGNVRAAVWRPESGIHLLSPRGPNSRANASNTDGTLIVGWSEDPATGNRQPTVWGEAGAIVLTETKAFCEATAVTGNGMIIVGQSYDPVRDQREAALWLDSDFGWVQESLGYLPGTLPGYGQAKALDLTEDGHTIVGTNSFDPNRATGFIWTLEDGLVNVHDYLADYQIALPEGFRITAVTAISADGSHMSGFGEDTTFWPRQARSFLINVNELPHKQVPQKILPAGADITNPFKTKDLR
jgi:uncharacterized membrane protein